MYNCKKGDSLGLKEDIRSFVIGVISGIVVSAIIEASQYFSLIHLPSNISAFLWVFIPISFGIIYLVLARHVKKQQEENMPFAVFGKYPPDNIMAIYKIEYFGVNWKVKIGTRGPPVFSIDPYAVAEGPYCPKCGYELDEYTKISFFGWKDKYYWRCEPCDKLYRRPDKTLFREDEVVEKIAMNKFRKEMEKQGVNLDRHMWSER